MEDERDQIIKQNNPNPYRDKAEEKVKKLENNLLFNDEEEEINVKSGWYCNKKDENPIEHTRRMRQYDHHSPILEKYVEDSREHEAEQIKENIQRMMKRGMLSEEDEKALKEKFGPHKMEYEAPECEPIELPSSNVDLTNYISDTDQNSFRGIAEKIIGLHERKNHDYGNAAHESYKEFGLVSYVIRLNDKMKRLKSLTKPGAEQLVADEKIEDTLMDLAAYAIMAIESLHSDD